MITTAYFRLNVLTSESNVIENTHTVIIDAGHGGEDGGAVNDNNVVEKDLNLQISVKLADMLTLFGYKTEQIRTEDKSVYTQGENVRQRKVSDMKNRLSVFNSNPENVVISIHRISLPRANTAERKSFIHQQSAERRACREYQTICKNYAPA